jgi:hypothetical protein
MPKVKSILVEGLRQSQIEESQMPAHIVSRSLIATPTSFDRGQRGFGGFARECWRKMTAMRADFESSESSQGARSRARSAERFHDDANQH